MIFTQVQYDDDDDRKSVATSNYISNGAEEDIAQSYHITLIEDGEVEEEDTEDVPVELEEGVKATVDKLKEVKATLKTLGQFTQMLMNLKMCLHGPTKKCPG
ncbi:UNVERIFIED_CONTAM: hypothetical protein Slati_2524300 [Sesamum latifolium]|uniref:Uncharacterized protein n=1 Tax=Sesamum latifolium TaxID=2727402 RepID=A0AAW2WF83_9LAMI